jgi:hypothetical protein
MIAAGMLTPRNGAITDKNDMGVQAAARLESHVVQITERVGAIMKIEIREGEAFLSPAAAPATGK